MIYRSIESYITSIILSYVDRYIKNFRREDVKLSLWEGDGVLNNLDLDLEVLEEELNLPFSFVSGHIHQLHIHVPWTRIASESVRITINTIECVMKLKPPGHRAQNPTKKKSRMNATGEESGAGCVGNAPPSYMASLVNKIVCNLTVTCNNLILKYLEGGMVLSMNIKTVSLLPVNKVAQPEFSELTATDLTLRKLVTLTDVTLCLDRRNSSGRIESYLEPLLYKCCLSVLISRSYTSVTCAIASSTRIAVHCTDFTFTVSQPQVSMLMRLIMLTQMAVAQSRDSSTSLCGTDSSHSVDGSSQDGAEDYSLEGWGSWLLGFVPLMGGASLPDSDGLSADIASAAASLASSPLSYTKIHFGLYIDRVTIILKLAKCDEAGRNWSGVMAASLCGCLLETSSNGHDWSNLQVGICAVKVVPLGRNHSPGGMSRQRGGGLAKETEDFNGNQETYMECGEVPESFMSGSLYDKIDLDLTQRPWDYHLSTLTETVMMERCPTFYFDYLSVIEKDSCYDFEIQSKLLGDNSQKQMSRYVIGPVSIKVCSGLLERLDQLRDALGGHYVSSGAGGGSSPTGVDFESRPTVSPPISPAMVSHERGGSSILLTDNQVEDMREALESEEGYRIGQNVSQLTLFGARIRIYPSDKSSLQQSQGNKSTSAPCHMLLRVKCVDTKWTKPSQNQVERLAALSQRIGPLPQSIVTSTSSSLSLLVVDSKLTLVVREIEGPDMVQISNLSVATTTNNLPCDSDAADNQRTEGNQAQFGPHLFTNSILLLEKLLIVCTKPKVILSYEIVTSLWNSYRGTAQENTVNDFLYNSTLVRDCRNVNDWLYLEGKISSTEIKFSDSTECRCFSVRVGDAAVSSMGGSAQQRENILEIVTGGGNAGRKESLEPLLIGLVQWPIVLTENDDSVSDGTISVPPIFLAKLSKTRISITKALCLWLLYTPQAKHRSAFDIMSTTGSGRKLSTSSKGSRKKRQQLQQQAVEGGQARSETESSIPQAMGGQFLSGASGAAPLPAADGTSQPFFNMDGLISGKWMRWLVCCECVGLEVCWPSPSESPGWSVTSTVGNVVVSSPLGVKVAGIHYQSSGVMFPLTVENWQAVNANLPWTVNANDIEVSSDNLGVESIAILSPTSVTLTVALTTRGMNSSLVSLCLHADTTPLHIALSHRQVMLVSELAATVSQVYYSLANQEETDISTPLLTRTYQTAKYRSQQPLSPDQTDDSASASLSFRYGGISKSGDTTSLISSSGSGPRLSVWLQWTLAKMSVSLYSPCHLSLQSKFLLDVDDVFVTFEVETLYKKLKLKVATASATHYTRSGTRDSWRTGEYSGVLMKGNDSTPATGGTTSAGSAASTDKDQSGDDFLSIIATRASGANLYAKLNNPDKGYVEGWGAVAVAAAAACAAEGRYITEIITRIQPLDFVLCPAVVATLMEILAPLMDADELYPLGRSCSLSPLHGQSMLNISSTSLPLFYFDVSLIRIFMPCSSPVFKSNANLTFEDTLFVHMEKVSVSSEAVNPVSRKFLRCKVSAGSAGGGGSVVAGLGSVNKRYSTGPSPYLDDRQYQLDVSNISVFTGNWNAVSRELDGECPSSQNPAVYWNSGPDCAAEKTPPTRLLSPLCLTVIVAPPIISCSVIISGLYIEVNAVSEIEGLLSLDQISLVTRLCVEFASALPNTGRLPPQNAMHERATCEIPQLTSHSAPNTVRESSLIDSGIESTDGSTSTRAPQLIQICKQDASPKSKVDVSSKPSKTTLKAKSMSQVSLSTTTSINTRKYHYRSQTVPIDILVTTKAIILKMYRGTGKSESLPSLLGSPSGGNVPLLYVLVSQPYVALEKQGDTSIIKGSVYEVEVRHGTINAIEQGTSDDFRSSLQVALVENAAGETDPYKEIPPPLVNFKATSHGVSPPSIEVEIGRPIKLLCQPASIDYLTSLRSTLLECLRVSSVDSVRKQSNVASTSCFNIGAQNQPKLDLCVEESNASSTSFQRIKSKLESCATVTISTKQVVLDFNTTNTNGHELLLSVGRMKASTEWGGQGSIRLSSEVAELCLTAASGNSGASYKVACPLIAGPWNLSASVGWRPSTSALTVCLGAGILTADLSQEIVDQVKCVSSEFLTYFEDKYPSAEVKNGIDPTQQDGLRTNSVNSSSPSHSLESEDDIHYQDDLQAGAFQFVTSGTVGKLPLPYQVIFPLPTQMSWAYPSPRTITKVRLLPIPLAEAGKITVTMDYMDDCYRWRRWLKIESDMTRSVEVSNAERPPRPASVWRATVDTGRPIPDSDGISAVALAAALRINSMHSPAAIPSLDVTLNFTSFQVSIWLHQQRVDKLPPPMARYVPDGGLPPYFPAATLYLERANVCLTHWSNNGEIWMECDVRPRLDLLNPRLLVEQCCLEPFPLFATARKRGSKCTLSLKLGRVAASIALPVAHTLLAASKGALLAPYIVANDTTTVIRFGQMKSSEDISLNCLQCNYYSWKSAKLPLKLRFRINPIDGISGWSEEGVNPSVEGSTRIVLPDETGHTIPIIVTVTHLSPTLTLVVVRGRLIVYNAIDQAIDCRIVSDEITERQRGVRLPAGDRAPTVPLTSRQVKHSLVLSIAERSWSGLIPLTTNNNVWLVKIPLRNRDDYLSVWCQIIHETEASHPRLFVIISPVYQVRSWLPRDVLIEISTPELDRCSKQIVAGRGRLSDLRAPGTASHQHVLRFFIEGIETDGCGGGIPLSYSLIDGRSPAPPPVPPIDDLITCSDSSSSQSSGRRRSWPLIDIEYADPSSLWTTIAPATNTLTNVKVKFGGDLLTKMTNSITLELTPWCLIANSTGLDLYIYESMSSPVNPIEAIASIPSRSVAAPPKLQGSFKFGIEFNGTIYKSNPVELSESQVFFMPHISGIVPISGALPLLIPVEEKIICLTLQSKMERSIRVVHIASSFSIVNISSLDLNFAAVLVAPIDRKMMIPQNIDNYAVPLKSQPLGSDPKGIGIINWHCLSAFTANSKYIHYLLFEYNGLISSPALITQSERHTQTILLPVRIDTNQPMSGAVTKCNIPLTVVTQTKEGVTYVIIDNCLSPQLIVHNITGVNLVCARVHQSSQASGSSSDATSSASTKRGSKRAIPVDDYQDWEWRLTVPAKCSGVYFLSRCEIQPMEPLRYSIVISKPPYAVWSSSIAVGGTASGRLVSTDGSGTNADFTATVVKRGPTTHLVLAKANQRLVAAADIRSRLTKLGKTSALLNEDILRRGYLLPPLSSPMQCLEDYQKMSVGSPDVSASPPIPPSTDNNLCLEDGCDEEDSRILLVIEGPRRGALSSVDVSCRIEGFTVTLCKEDQCRDYCWSRLATLSLESISIESSANQVNCGERFIDCHISEIQVDNDEYRKGGYDFGVVALCKATSDSEWDRPSSSSSESAAASDSMAYSGVDSTCGSRNKPALHLSITIDQYTNPVLQDVVLKLSPIEVFLEDVFLTTINTEVTKLLSDPFIVQPEAYYGTDNEETPMAKSIQGQSVVSGGDSSNQLCYEISMQQRKAIASVGSDEDAEKGSSDGCYGGSCSGSSDSQSESTRFRSVTAVSLSSRYSPARGVSAPPPSIIHSIDIDDECEEEHVREEATFVSRCSAASKLMEAGRFPFPRSILLSAVELSRPLLLRTLTVSEFGVLVSLHTSTRFYIALDNSPLRFSEFSRRELITTTYRLGHALTLHYFLGAIYGTGWALGSLQLLGAPAGLARSFSQGLKSFITMPCVGAIQQGPTGFFVGVLHGSVSLMKHITAGTLLSLTKFAGSWSRTLDRLTLDDEDLRYTEEMRRLRPHGLTQSLKQGLTELGVSLLGAVGGLAQQPLDYVSQGNKSLAGALGSALVGAVTRPLSGAAEFLALTGHGILSGAGWTDNPQPKYETGCSGRWLSAVDSRLKAAWIVSSHAGVEIILGQVAATWSDLSPVTLVVTSSRLIAISASEGHIISELSLTEIEVPTLDPVDPTRVNIMFVQPPDAQQQSYTMRRVEDYIRKLGGNQTLPDYPDVFTGPLGHASGGQSIETAQLAGVKQIEIYLSPDLRERLVSLCRIAVKSKYSLGFQLL